MEPRGTYKEYLRSENTDLLDITIHQLERNQEEICPNLNANIFFELNNNTEKIPGNTKHIILLLVDFKDQKMKFQFDILIHQ